MIQNLNSKQESVERLNTMLSSGKSLLSPADGPFAWAQAMNVKQSIRELDTIDENIDFALNWQQATESSLDRMYDLLLSAQQLAIASVKPSSEEETLARVTEMEQLCEEAQQVANTQYNNLYIFSGWGIDYVDGKTVLTASNPPFDSDLNYQGSTDSLKVRTNTSRSETVNLDGETVFVIQDADGQPINILQMLADLRDSIQDSVATDDVQPIQDAQELIVMAQQHISSQQAMVGARMASLDQRKEVLADLQLNAQERYAEIAEPDYVDLIMQYQQKQTALEAAMKVTSLISELNLTKYL